MLKNGNILRRLILYATVITALLLVLFSNSTSRTSKFSGHLPSQRKLTISKPILVSAEAPIITPQATPSGVSGEDAKLFIYNKESGNKTTARNSGGCLGLGQACPGSKLLAVCPDLNDYACQDAFSTSYAMNRYGSWDNAKAFWLAHNWW